MRIALNDVTFEVVETIPLGYEIWSIGENMIPGYLPFCRLSARQPFPGGRNVETDTLKAVKCSEAQTVLAAAHCGCVTIEKMEDYLKKNPSPAPGSYAYVLSKRIRKALPIMRQLRQQ